MLNTMKSLYIFLKLLFVFFVFLTPLSAQKIIKVGVYENAPLIFMKRDSAGGYYADIINNIAKKENWLVKYKACSLADGLKELREGKIDVLPIMAPSPQRLKYYDFTIENIVTDWAEIYMPKISKDITFFDMQNKKIAVLKKDLHADAFRQIMKDFMIDCKIIEVDSYYEAMALVENKKADFCVVSHYFGVKNMYKYNLQKSHIMFNARNISIAFKKNPDRELATIFDNHIKSLKDNKESVFYKGIDNWLVMPLSVKHFFVHGLVNLFIVVLILYFFYMASKIPIVQKKLGFSHSVHEKVSTNILIFTAVYIVFIWFFLATLEYYLLNDANKSYLTFLELNSNPNRILSRTIMISSILLAGVIISNIFARLYKEQERLKELLKKIKDSERRWQFALEGSKSGVWDWNIKTNKLFFSKQWKAMLGHKEDEIGDDISEWKSRVHPDDLQRCLKDLDDFVSSGAIYYENVHRLRTKDGLYKWILDRGKIVQRENGKAIRAIGTHNDITESVLAKEELRKKEELMIAQSRHAAMGEMISMIAHQWRQPLSVISISANNTLVDVELDMLDNKSVEENTNLILTQTQELSKTIDDFKNFFKPQKTKEEVYVKDIFNEAFRVIGKSLENSNVEVITKFECKRKMQTYSRELMQVFINILKNAKEVLESENIEHKKIFITVEDKQESVNIKIRDNAGGISKENISQVFDPYFSTKDEKVGTGLGLYMSKIIIQKHLKGEIDVYNKDGGACFEIEIPYVI